ncbi:acyl-CoA dehydrogenase [Steroidobacter denitrificans]|uniref:Acyl-CoA dehydrogenase n=1 Tax=Steroidobacter denitrificans TaxID=465721 RepID=A0A127F588_STEDE|nr:acyl-CoA dehydrogenase family protein [Steroidobacter denitrificans]AMN45602.1 acyl-CoA dehydrogenase [Steroidobacter denitrificans]
MTLLLNDEQRLLRDSARDFLATRSPVAALRALRDRGDERGYDPQLWHEIAELGWPAAVLPEAYGGLGVGYKGLGAVFEQIGRTLAATPLLPTVVLGGGLLAEAGSTALRDFWLPKIAAGEALFALALEEAPRHDPTQVTLRAWSEAGHWRLDGDKQFVLDGHIADRMIVVARSSGTAGQQAGLSLFLVDPATPGVQIERTSLVDSRNAARVRFSQVQLDGGALIGAPDQAFAVLDAVLDRARACIAAELLGVITEAFERTVAYLKERVQFDVRIGSFQALQHRAARLHVEIELLRSSVAAALEAMDAAGNEAAELVSVAKARASDLSEKALNEAVQMHGGVGVTDALEIGFFLKRARVLQQTFGDGSYHRDRYARLRGF